MENNYVAIKAVNMVQWPDIVIRRYVIPKVTEDIPSGNGIGFYA